MKIKNITLAMLGLASSAVLVGTGYGLAKQTEVKAPTNKPGSSTEIPAPDINAGVDYTKLIDILSGYHTEINFTTEDGTVLKAYCASNNENGGAYVYAPGIGEGLYPIFEEGTIGAVSMQKFFFQWGNKIYCNNLGKGIYCFDWETKKSELILEGNFQQCWRTDPELRIEHLRATTEDGLSLVYSLDLDTGVATKYQSETEIYCGLGGDKEFFVSQSAINGEENNIIFKDSEGSYVLSYPLEGEILSVASSGGETLKLTFADKVLTLSVDDSVDGEKKVVVSGIVGSNFTQIDDGYVYLKEDGVTWAVTGGPIVGTVEFDIGSDFEFMGPYGHETANGIFYFKAVEPTELTRAGNTTTTSGYKFKIVHITEEREVVTIFDEYMNETRIYNVYTIEEEGLILTHELTYFVLNENGEYTGQKSNAILTYNKETGEITLE